MRLFVLAGTLLLAAAPGEEPAPPSEWTLPAGFVVEKDTGGYLLPTAIAFVPHPGPGPKDPLYFVVELRGQVKAVSNDRTVTTFAQGFAPTEYGNQETPEGTAEFGAAGICLDPAHGYVFVTFAYQDRDKLLRNGILRFDTKPDTFAARPTGQTSFSETFRPFKSGVSHQIGPCQVVGDRLYVSVGDGFDAPQGSQRLDTLLGKVLRLTLDGAPAPGNPYYDADEPGAPAGYVWAYGVRNPFGLKAVGEHLLAADNGLSTDRFLEIERGRNYLWDGTERSMAINVPAVIAPSVGPVQMDYLPATSTLFPEEFRDRFFLALSGRVPGIMTFDYGIDRGEMRSTPAYFMQKRGPGKQMLTGLAFGPDGLYFTPIIPEGEEGSAVYRIRHDAQAGGKGTLLENPEPWTLLYEKGCFGCHRIGNVGTRGGIIGPALEQEGLRERLGRMLASKEYLQSLDAVDRLDTEPQSSFRAARQELRRAQGEDRLRTWVTYRVQEPRFDRILSAMPNCNVSAPEAERIADVLLGKKPPPITLKTRLVRLVPSRPGPKSLLMLLAVAFSAGLAGGAALLLLLRRRAGARGSR